MPEEGLIERGRIALSKSKDEQAKEKRFEESLEILRSLKTTKGSPSVFDRMETTINELKLENKRLRRENERLKKKASGKKFG